MEVNDNGFNHTIIKDIVKLGQLKKAGYVSKPIKQEMRLNLIRLLKSGLPVFEGIQGFEDSVIPQVQTAILSKHNILFLGLRGQAKTRMARLFVNLLDEYIPVIKGSELMDDPFNPLSWHAREMVLHHGDDTEIEWIHRSQRYAEKLATPDVSVADLIGDVDPIKAASLKLNYADERIIHYGLVPRANRSIFVINELPDLQARIQVALFNILQEGDIQIRGFRFRLPLDVQFVFTANPEDYTNRGNIVTPLKDRIGSQIMTHYPKTVATALAITEQEAQLDVLQKETITCHQLIKELIEQIAFEARNSELIDQKSGVSARLTISAYETLVSVAERRQLINNETRAYVRISDLICVVPAITGKVELVYEGELEGVAAVAYALIGKAIRKQFVAFFPDPGQAKKSKKESPYQQILQWFNEGNSIDLLNEASQKEYEMKLKSIQGLEKTIQKLLPDLNKNELMLFMEFMLHGLSEFSLISKNMLNNSVSFKDLVGSMFSFDEDEN